MSRRRLPQAPAWWYDGSPPPLHARLLSTLYGGLTALRRGAYRRGWLHKQRVAVPVVVVGNITAGGTGKTPLVIALVARLRAAGWTPGIASRGHGREHEATPRWVDADAAASLVGDEPLLIARATAAKVRVDRDRVAAARALVAAGCDIVVCDHCASHWNARRTAGSGYSTSASPARAWQRARQASANGRCGCRSAPCSPCTAGARSRWRCSPASACMRWPGSATRSVSSPCCAMPGSRWCRMRSPTTMPTPRPISTSAAACRC